MQVNRYFVWRAYFAPMKVLIAPDKFKGSLTAAEAAQAMAEAVARHNPSWQVQMVPLADGGEGTAELLTAASNGSIVTCTAADAVFRPVRCEYGISADGTTAFIDASEASGMKRLSPNERNPLRCSSRGTGEIMVQAFHKRVKRIVVGLGGTASMEAGTGIIHALGVVLLGENRKPLMPTGANLGKIEYLDLSKFAFRESRIEVIFLSDVHLPLLEDAPEGGVMRFGKQKGLKEEDGIFIHAAFGKFRNFMESEYRGQPKLPGMGAGGGAAFALSSIYPCKLQSGADWVLRELGLEAAIHNADLIITGEGTLDATTLDGKCISALARLASRQEKPVMAVVGRNALSAQQTETLGLKAVESIEEIDTGLEPDAMAAFDGLVHATTRMLRNMAPRLGNGTA